MARSRLTSLKSRDFCYMYTLASDFCYILSTYIGVDLSWTYMYTLTDDVSWGLGAWGSGRRFRPLAALGCHRIANSGQKNSVSFRILQLCCF